MAIGTTSRTIASVVFVDNRASRDLSRVSHYIFCMYGTTGTLVMDLVGGMFQMAHHVDGSQHVYPYMSLCVIKTRHVTFPYITFTRAVDADL